MIAMSAKKHITGAVELHWVHWIVVALSLVLTLTAWRFSSLQQKEKIDFQFNREANQVVELVLERMRKYEDGLWGGVSAIHSHHNNVSYSDWHSFASSLRLEEKYPGINGIGIIHYVSPQNLDVYLKIQHEDRPDFQIHPEHDNQEFWPITYIEPYGPNSKAVGLDMAHESNRLTAAKKARDTGKAQITGPITLVQDKQKTPGFLFFAPFFKEGHHSSEQDHDDCFIGLVYAPFIVNKLMQGTLEKERRHISLSISDGEQIIYNELTNTEPDFDPTPLFKSKQAVAMYGRTWVFELWSTKSFREMVHTGQPLIILFGGLLIDSLLLILFVVLSRSNRNAIHMAEALEQSNMELEQNNAELEQFAYIASHDLQEPLRKVQAFADRLQSKYGNQFDEKGQQYLKRMHSSANRMQNLIQDLLTLSRITREARTFMEVDLSHITAEVLEALSQRIEETKGKVIVEKLRSLDADPVLMHQLLQNLIGNALKFHKENVPPVIKIYGELTTSNSNAERMYQLYIEDNGIGFDEKHLDRIFLPFQRLHGRTAYEGTGIGAAIVKKIVDHHGGNITARSELGHGSTFIISLPLKQGT